KVASTLAEGPGRRAALWVRGCSLRCPGCCNPDLFESGSDNESSTGLQGSVDLEKLASWLRECVSDRALEGLSILGGEPLEQIEGVAALSRVAQGLGLGVILYTGYEIERWQGRVEFEALWSAVDTFVDGPFDARQPERAASRPRRYVGSRNQRLVHRSSRYADEGLWF